MTRFIYFLLKGGKVIYIGQTKNVRMRLAAHKYLGYTSYRAIECKAELANYYEYRWILKFKPKFNDLSFHPHNWMTAKNTGRKPTFQPERLKIGEKMKLTGKARKFKDQYLYAFNNRGDEKFKTLEIDGRVFLERVS